jgi:trimeric autotransporter adhesin
VNPGGTATLSATLTVSGTAPAGLEWRISYSPSQISAISITAGPATSAATKTLSCAAGSGVATCIVTGMNTNALASGVVAYISATVASGTTSAPIQISNPMGADSSGDGLSITSASSGSIVVPSLSPVICSPTSLSGSAVSTCTVTLTQKAPAGGTSVKLASNSALLSVPASITVAAGATTATFSATAAASIASNQSATVTATLGGSTQTVALSLLAPGSLSGLACSPASLGSSGVSTCTVTLSTAAPTGGSSVTLMSNNTLLTVPASVKVAAGATSITFSATAAASITSNQSAIVTATLGSASQTFTIALVAPALVSALVCSPSSLSPGGVSTCTVTLNAAAPTGGVSLTLQSSNTLLTVPSSVTVAAGATTGTFSVTAAATFTSSQTATVTATLGSSSKTATISGVTVTSATPSFIQEKDNRVTSGKTSGATFSSTTAGNLIVVYLIWDNTGTAAVSDSLGNTYTAAVGSTLWNNSQYRVETFYTINRSGGANTVTATFATAVTSFGIIYADEYSGVAQTAPVDVTAAAAGASGSLNSGTVSTTNSVDLLFAGGVSGNTVTAPGAGYTARSTFAGNMTEDEVVSAKGSYSATASNSSGAAWAMQMVAFKGAAAGGGTVLISGLTCNPTSLGPGSVSTCTVTLNAAAPTGGSNVKLTTNTAWLTVPASVTVAGGATTATFTATASTGITSSQNATVTATLGSSSQTATIALIAPGLVSALTCNPASLGPGGVSTCTVTLNSAAPTGGANVTLTTNTAWLNVPASVTVAAGATTATFNATASAGITINQNATVTATLGSSSQTATIALVAPGLVSALACSPSSLSPSGVSKCTVTLSSGAPTGGSSVTLKSNNTLLSVPASVTVAAGATAASFNATAAATFTSSQTATVTASLGSSSKTATITGVTVTSAVPKFIQEKDNQVTSGKTSSATFSSSTTAGNLIVVYLIWDNTGTAAVSDSIGNTYAAAIGSTLWSNNQSKVQTFYAINRSSGANTVTATFATAITSYGIIYADEYSGVAQTTPVDVTAAAAGASGSLNSGTVNTTNSADLLFAGGASGNTVTAPGAGYTARSTFVGNMTEDEVVSAKGSYSATASNSSGAAWAMQLVAFKAASGTAGSNVISTLRRARPASVAATSMSAPTEGSAVRGNTTSSLHCSPRVIAGGAVTCELLATANAQSVQVPLNSSSEHVLIPAVITTRPNQSSLTFQAETSRVSKQQSVTITAALDTGAVQDTILLMAASGPVLRAPQRQISKAGASVSFNVSAVDPSGLPVQIQGTSIPAGASFDPLTGAFEWTPQVSQVGKYGITFTATNSARESSTTQVELDVDSGLPALDLPSSSCSSGAIGTLHGKWLAAPGSQLSDPSGGSFDLGGTSVAVNGQAVPVLSSSADRVDFLCPTTGTGTQLSVTVTSRFGSSQPVTMVMDAAAPAILSIDDSPQNQGLISFYGANDLVMERNYRGPAHPAQPGDQIVIFATGLGSAAESSPGTMVVKLSDVYVGVESVQAVSGYAGVYAVQVRVPGAMAFGAVPVQLQIMTPDSRQLNSNIVTGVFEAVRQ